MSNLNRKQFGPTGSGPVDPADQEIYDAANLRVAGAQPQRGPIGPFDADKIDRNNRAVSETSDFGMQITPLHSRQDENRGFTVDTGIPDVSVILGARSRGGYSVDVVHGDRFRSNDDGSYAYPEGWGSHSDVLNVSDESELPGAVMDHLARPDVRRHMFPPESK